MARRAPFLSGRRDDAGAHHSSQRREPRIHYAAEKSPLRERVQGLGCRFLAGLGGYGVVVGNASARVTVTRSLFRDAGQGGVLFFGVDDETTTGNRSPKFGNVSWNVFKSLGRTLVHVAAVGLRAASHTYVGHNRITDVPRYAIQADTFYDLSVAGGRLSTDNVFEFNVVDLACSETTDVGAFELLGSQDPALVDFDLRNVIRYNKVSRTLGSSSSDGAHVCRGEAYDARRGCRGLAWSIYLDGAYSGAHVHGNVLDGSSKGAIIINGGGNVTFENNVVLNPKTSAVELSTCWAPNDPRRARWPGNRFERNIFALDAPTATAYALPGPPNTAECTFIPGRLSSDGNLFSGGPDLATRPLFPSNGTLAEWQRGNATAPGARDAPPFKWQPLDVASLVADAKFADAANGQLQPDSPAFALGWLQLPDIEGAVPPPAPDEPPLLVVQAH